MLSRYPRLRDYARRPEVQLNELTVTHANADQINRRREHWSCYLQGDPSGKQVPLSTRMIPLLISLILDGDRGLPAVLGSLYPAGYRTQVLGHSAMPAGAMDSHLNAPSAPTWAGDVRRMLDSPSTEPSRLASIAALLNALTLYGVTVSELASRSRHVQNWRLSYEVARAAYSIRQTGDLSIRPFKQMAVTSGAPLVTRLNALTRTVAHYCRRDRDYVECAQWLAMADELATNANMNEYEPALAVSRLNRAGALYEWRRKNMLGISQRMETANTIARQLIASSVIDSAEHLLACQDERLVLEATLKAYIGSDGTAAIDATAAASRILELDPFDPYTLLIAGDAWWVQGDEKAAIGCFEIANTLGTLPGALATQRLGTVYSILGMEERSRLWLERAVELDREVATSVQ